jgi:non-ribosomal peptide synthetase component F
MKAGKYSYRLALAANQNVKERDYWLAKLSDNPAKIGFPYDYRGASDSTAARQMEREEFAWTGQFYERLMNLSSRNDYTLHVILAAGLTVLLGRYTGSEDILLGIPIYKQETDIEFINTVLVLRNQLKDSMTFKELLLQTRQEVVEAAKHQNYPFPVLLDRLNLPAAVGENPLFDAVLLLENIHDKTYIRDVDYTVLLSFLRTGREVRGVVEYDSRLYRQGTIRRIIDHFTLSMEGLTADVEGRLPGAELMSERERTRILEDFNCRRYRYTHDTNIVEIFERQVQKTPDHHVCFEKGEYVTFKELDKRADILARIISEVQ